MQSDDYYAGLAAILADPQTPPLPACTNCGDPLGLSALYCERCTQRDCEPWFAWRDRLATVRRQLATEGDTEPMKDHVARLNLASAAASTLRATADTYDDADTADALILRAAATIVVARASHLWASTLTDPAPAAA